jgi:hypothetical protein
MKIERITLQRVQYMPKQLEPGVLYVSEEFGTAAHLCACGCGAKIRTPLGATEWNIEETTSGPSLWPSVGNWQQACRSHYVISRGRIQWAGKWSAEQIAAGRHHEEDRRKAYYDAMYAAPKSWWHRMWLWFLSFFHK